MNKKKLLLSSGRFPQVLGFIRTLASPEIELYVVDSHKIQVSKYSKYVKKSFVVPSPKFAPQEHIQSLIALVKEEKIDYFLPSWEDIFLVAKHAHLFPPETKLFISDYTLLETLHHKEQFIHLSAFLGFLTPKTFLLKSPEDLAQIPFSTYALKACFSRGSQKVYKISPDQPIPSITPTPAAPWIAQEWITGKNYSSYSICQEGRVYAHVTYPIEFSSTSKKGGDPSVSSYALSFVTLRHEGIQQWVETFARKTLFTGQIAFDFIETPQGALYAIECNPRLTSGGFLFTKEDHLVHAIIDHPPMTIQPKAGLKRQIILAMLFLGWKKAYACKKMRLFLKHIFTFKDIVFDLKDPTPAFALPLLWIKYAFDSFRYKKSIQSVIMHDLDYDG